MGRQRTAARTAFGRAVLAQRRVTLLRFGLGLEDRLFEQGDAGTAQLDMQPSQSGCGRGFSGMANGGLNSCASSAASSRSTLTGQVTRTAAAHILCNCGATDPERRGDLAFTEIGS